MRFNLKLVVFIGITAALVSSVASVGVPLAKAQKLDDFTVERHLHIAEHQFAAFLPKAGLALSILAVLLVAIFFARKVMNRDDEDSSDTLWWTSSGLAVLVAALVPWFAFGKAWPGGGKDAIAALETAISWDLEKELTDALNSALAKDRPLNTVIDFDHSYSKKEVKNDLEALGKKVRAVPKESEDEVEIVTYNLVGCDDHPEAASYKESHDVPGSRAYVLAPTGAFADDAEKYLVRIPGSRFEILKKLN